MSTCKVFFKNRQYLWCYTIYGTLSFKSQTLYLSGFSIIMWEFTSGIPLFNNRAHDLQLSLSVCKGEHPEISENTPQCYYGVVSRNIPAAFLIADHPNPAQT
jgi:hypothetical protein